VSGPRAHRIDAALAPDPSRVVLRLFLPGEELAPGGRARVDDIIARVLALSEETVETAAAALVADFGPRHPDLPELFQAHVGLLGRRLADGPADMTPARRMVLGATFTAEYSVEGAALCNPSAVPHPDQSGLGAGELRVAVSLRAVGEGHVSSLCFASAVVGPGPSWTWEPRQSPLLAAVASPGSWDREHLRALLEARGLLDELTLGVLARLPERFLGTDLSDATAHIPSELLGRHGASDAVEAVRRLAAAPYEATFPTDSGLTRRVLLPVVAEERHGIEDARFVLFVDDDGTAEYHATYTAYDGEHVTQRRLVSPDLRTFAATTLAGPAAVGKGMAMFPRLVGGIHLALCRSDGETTSLTRSVDGLVWEAPEAIHVPALDWELVQVGNCGAPIETPEGWLVLTHGVGPMRTYAIGAMLLDLADPSHVVARLDRPLLTAAASERDGYVPNVVYSCGGTVHDNVLWLPYGVSDVQIRVAWIALDELLGGMRRTDDAP
jgi:predicted GH43/DUF377 family glycosyl hydrolase